MDRAAMQSDRPEADSLESWLTTAMRKAHVAIGVSRMDNGAFVEVNDAFCRLFHWPREEVLGRSSAELGLWPDRAQRDRMLAHLGRSGGVSGFEARYRNRDGEVGDLEISATIVERDGQPHLVGILNDVSGRRELIDGLQATQSRLDVVLRASGMLVFRQDRELRHSWVANPALGASEADVLGRTDDEILGSAAAAPLVAIKRRVLETGRAERRDVWVANNGQLGCFDLIVEPERDAAAQVTGIICAATDITQRVTAPATQQVRAARRAQLNAIDAMTTLIGREALSGRQLQRLQRIRVQTHRLADVPAPSDAAPLRRLRAEHAGARVLVTEANAVLREMLVALLESAGMRVSVAVSGVEAFSACVQLEPALLLLDMELPQRGAVAAVMAVRATLRRRLPIVALVSSQSPERAATALDADLDDLLDKPVAADALYAKVLMWLDYA